MLFFNILLVGITSAAPTLTSRQVTAEYAPWEITAVSAARGGRPNSDPNATLKINIKQPNTVKLQRVPRGYAVLPAFEASCEFIWPRTEALPVGEAPYSTVGDTSTYGGFTMMVTGTSLDDFSVTIKESRDITIFQQQYIRIFEGKQAFKRDDGVWTVRCSSGGQCNWNAVSVPLQVKQELTSSVGSCKEASTGSCQVCLGRQLRDVVGRKSWQNASRSRSYRAPTARHNLCYLRPWTIVPQTCKLRIFHQSRHRS